MSTDLMSARDWVFEVESVTPDTWVEIDGIDSFQLNPGENEEVADTSLFRSQGQYEEQKMQRGATLGLKGKKITAVTTPDAGQLRVETLAGLVSDASIGSLRFRHSVQTTWVVWEATVSLGTVGGGKNDKASWEATFTRCGAAASAAVS